MTKKNSIALIIPCLNEEIAIAKVIDEFQSIISDLDIYVIDNGSVDKTAEIAKNKGANVLFQPMRGKGNAIRLAFAEIQSNIYLVVDGDCTYDATSSLHMINKLIAENLDMVVGVRKHQSKKAYRLGHEFGNQLFNGLFKKIFGYQFSDVNSGYRAFSHAFVKSFPAQSSGFDIEAEFSVHCVNLKLPTGEIDTNYRERAIGSYSKLNTYIDGILIFKRMMQLLSRNKPMAFYGFFSFLALILGLLLFLPVLSTYLNTGLVPRFPSLIVAVSSIVVACLIFMTGIILQTMLSFQAENRHLAYLAAKAPHSPDARRNLVAKANQ